MPQTIETVKKPTAEVPAKAEKPGGKNLRVLHTQMGAWPRGFVLSADDLPVGADVGRLLDIGAVEKTDDPRTGDAPLGPATIAASKVAKSE